MHTRNSLHLGCRHSRRQRRAASWQSTGLLATSKSQEAQQQSPAKTHRHTPHSTSGCAGTPAAASHSRCIAHAPHPCDLSAMRSTQSRNARIDDSGERESGIVDGAATGVPRRIRHPAWAHCAIALPWLRNEQTQQTNTQIKRQPSGASNSPKRQALSDCCPSNVLLGATLPPPAPAPGAVPPPPARRPRCMALQHAFRPMPSQHPLAGTCPLGGLRKKTLPAPLWPHAHTRPTPPHPNIARPRHLPPPSSPHHPVALFTGTPPPGCGPGCWG